MTKESLREKFWKDCKDKKIEPMSECEQIDMMFDFFWNEMKKEREGIINRIENEMPTAWFPESALHLKKKYFDQVLALIKQSNDNRE